MDGEHAPTNGSAHASMLRSWLVDALEREPHAFDFFQALRLLECAHPERPRVGMSVRLADDPVRLGQEPSLAFAPATVASVRHGGSQAAPWLIQRAIGLFGPNGPLPLHLTEYARDRSRHHEDETFSRFADIFHHRMLSLFYRAWADAEPAVQYDRPDTDRFATYVGSLLGIGVPALVHRDGFPDLAKLHFAGRFAAQTRNAEGLETILSEYFSVRAEVRPFSGHWLEIPEDGRTRLGAAPGTGTLGRTAIVGSRIWDCQHKFDVVLGPMSFHLYQRLLPAGESLPALVALLRNYVGLELMWDVRLILQRDEVPPIVLGESGQLGRTCWLRDRPLSRDPGDYKLPSTAFDDPASGRAGPAADDFERDDT